MALKYIYLFHLCSLRSYVFQDANEEKTWVDKMSDAVGCITLDALGATIAIGHGEKVTVINQTTICAYGPTPFHILTTAVF